MKDQFDIWEYNFPQQGLHSVVLISHPDFCSRSQRVNVLYCTSQRQSRPAKYFEVMLDRADGFDWETFCDCSVLWLAEAAKLIRKRGHVVLERRRQIRSKLQELFRLQATD